MATYRPLGPILLYSTSPLPAPQLAINLALRQYPQALGALKMVVLQTPLENPAASGVSVLLEQFSGHGVEIVATDPGLQQRADAFQSDVVNFIREADIILVTGGDPTRVVRIIRDTPALVAMREASARGAIVGGGSAGAMMFGHGFFNGHLHDRRSERLLGWLPDILVAPHFGNYPIEPWQETFPNGTILGLPDTSVALVTDCGTRVTSAGEVPLTMIDPREERRITVQPGDSWTRRIL